MDLVDLLILLVKAAAVLGLAWALTRARWCSSAAVRHGLWSLATISTLCLPFTGAWVPSITIEVPDIVHFASEPAPTSLAAGPERGSTIGQGHLATGEFVEPVALGSSEPESTEARRSSIPVVDWSAILLIAWLAGTALRIGWLFILYLRTWGLTRRAVEVGGDTCRRPALELAESLGIRRKVRVLESAEVSMPLAWGSVRPVIILPLGAEEWPEERLRVVLLHELAHVRRWDYLTSFLAELACAAYWPLPLVWTARRSIRIEQEQACDDRVLTMGTTAVAYAEHLLAIARAFYGQRWELGMVVTMAREISLKHRVRAILDEHTDRRPLRSAAGLTASAVLIALYLPVAALHGDNQEAPVVRSDGDGEAAAVEDAISEPAARTIRPVEPVSIWLEAEWGVARGDIEPGQDLDASAAGYLAFDPPRRRSANGSAQTQEVSFVFTLPAAGEYLIWGRMEADRRGPAVSLDASIDGGAPRIWTVDGADDWSWSRLAAANSGVHLDAGRHTLRLGNPDDDIQIDRILLTSDASYRPSGRGAKNIGAQPVYSLLEAETATLAGRLRLKDENDASAGEYVVFHSGRRGRPDGTAAFDILIEEAGRYLIWARSFAPDRDSNSFYASLDGSPEAIWDTPTRRRDSGRIPWSWTPLSARTDDGGRIDPLVHDLPAGRHTFRLRAREDGVRLDALLVTNDLDSRPEGLWPATLPPSPTYLSLEAEGGTLSPPLTIHDDPAADGSRFVSAARDGRADRPGEAGSVRLSFSIAEEGIYSLWGRTITPSSDRDSFWVRVDDAEWILWNGIPDGDSWNWSAVRDDEASNQLVQFQLAPGSHTLEIAGREGGAMLDRVVITDDPLFEPG